MGDPRELDRENQELRERLKEAQAVLAALRSGTVDAIVVGEGGERQLFALSGAETPYRVFVEAMHEGAAMIDAGGHLLYANGALGRMLGAPLEKLIGASVIDALSPADRAAAEALLHARAAAQAELELTRRDGRKLRVLASATRHDGQGVTDLVLTDLAERDRGALAEKALRESERSRRAMLSVLEDERQARAKLQRSNRALRTLSAGNETLVRAADEPALLAAMTRILVEVGGYPMAFVAYARDDAEKSVEPMACAGIEERVLREPPVSWAEGSRGNSVVARAIRTGEVQVQRCVAESGAYAPWREFLRARGVRSTLGLPLRFAPGERAFGAIGIATAADDAFDAEELRLLDELAGDLAYGIAVVRGNIQRRETMEKLSRSLENTIGAVAATMEMRDPYTAGHQRRVAALAAAIAAEMGLAVETVRGIHFGGLIHDIGKIQVPAEMLAKPTRLTKIEFELIKVHPQAGYDIIKGIEFPWPVAEMVHQHHERLDGSGYPQGLKGEAIALEARILAVADVVEAISSHRPYRPALGIDAALNEIEDKRGVWFDPRAVDACVRLFRQKGFTYDKAA